MTLKDFIATCDLNTLQAIASDSTLPLEAQLQLLQCDNPNIRKTLARNEYTSSEISEKLATDSEWIVRYAVAKKTKTPKKILQQLLNDPEENVCRAAAENPKLKKS